MSLMTATISLEICLLVILMRGTRSTTSYEVSTSARQTKGGKFIITTSFASSWQLHTFTCNDLIKITSSNIDTP